AGEGPQLVALLDAPNALVPSPGLAAQNPNGPFTALAAPAVPVGAMATGSGQLFFSVPSAFEPIGRFAEPSLKFPPASGGSGEQPPADLALLPAPAPTTEEVAAPAEEPVWYS